MDCPWPYAPLWRKELDEGLGGIHCLLGVSRSINEKEEA